MSESDNPAANSDEDSDDVYDDEIMCIHGNP